MLNPTPHEPRMDTPPVLPAPPIAQAQADPGARPVEPAVSPARHTRRMSVRLSTPVCFGIWLLIVAAAIVLGNLNVWTPIMVIAWVAIVVTLILATFTALWRALRGAVDAVRYARGGGGDVYLTVMGALGNLLMAGFGMCLAYLSTVGFSRGRQLRRFGKVLLPDLRPDGRWTTDIPAHGLESAPAGLADQWRENGKTEHASVAAFARLTLDLMALGAPPALIRTVNEDALDEIRHAELCFSLASAMDGKRIGPAPFPQAQRVSTLPRSRRLALTKLAVDSLVDGALHEGVSARIIAKLSQRCAIPAIHAALKEIAADEGRHAAHGWAVTRWCFEEGGDAVAFALAGAVRSLPKEMRSDLREAAADGGWEHWGIHGHGLEAEEYTAARAHLVERVRALVAAVKTPAA